jgi:uncharacterized protein (DUF2336 family)
MVNRSLILIWEACSKEVQQVLEYGMVFEQFIRWLSIAESAHRVEAAFLLSVAYLDEAVRPDEREGIEAAMTVLLEDPDPEVRDALAQSLAMQARAPRHIVLGLANDLPNIAATVVARSPVLIDAELVDIVATADEIVQVAAASRARVSSSLSAALAEVGGVPALVALIRNPQATVQSFSYRRIVERHGDDPDLSEIMLSRQDLPIEVRHDLLDRLSTALQNLVVNRALVRQERAEEMTREARDKATVALAASASASEVGALVEHLRLSGQLTTTLLLRAACRGNIRFLEEALARLSGTPIARVFALLSEGREAPFRALYKKAGLPGRAYPAFATAIEVNREAVWPSTGSLVDESRFARMVIDRVVQRYQSAETGPPDDLLMLLRRFAAEAARDAARSFAVQAVRAPLQLAGPPDSAPRDRAA